MSRNKKFEYNTESCILKARTTFEEIAQIGGSEVMREEAGRALEAIRPNINAKALCEFYDEFKLEGEYLTLRGSHDTEHILLCKAFAQIDPATVKSVCVFALTAGNCRYDGDRIMAQLFADYWGTAVVEAVKQELVRSLKRELAFQYAEDYLLSEFFGPGLYGMDLSQMRELPALCDFAKLGLSVSETGYLMPEKSVAGLIFIVNEDYKGLDEKCESCEGNTVSCNLCTA